ncbi:MAG: M50 family metallopeptidase [Minisyncoccia bacterium]
MEILLLIVVLVALILVHELGHFVAAKLSGMRVDEFGIGYPPRAWGIQRGETLYSINWLPFGGFVKIYGEDLNAPEDAEQNTRSFSAKSHLAQAIVLVAGIAMNLVFAWIIISGILFAGTPRALESHEIPRAQDATIVIAEIMPGSPAETAGLNVGDSITQVIVSPEDTFTGADPAAFTAFIAKDTTKVPLTFDIKREGKQMILSAIPATGIVAGDESRVALGVRVASVGTVPVSWWQAPIVGAQYTWEITKQTAVGLAQFFYGIFTFSADLTQVSGPVGIAGAVGTASKAGFSSLMSLTAVISINLALINLIPIPALDGGRLLFVLIETITRKRIKPMIATVVNTTGFGLLVLLMVVVTVHDIWKLVG